VHVFRDVSYEQVRHAYILLSVGAPRKRPGAPRKRRWGTRDLASATVRCATPRVMRSPSSMPVFGWKPPR
jgi:hypothetical protein